MSHFSSSVQFVFSWECTYETISWLHWLKKIGICSSTCWTSPTITLQCTHLCMYSWISWGMEGVEKGFKQQFIGKNALTYPMDLYLSALHFLVGTKLAGGVITIGNQFWHINCSSPKDFYLKIRKFRNWILSVV